MKSLTKLAFTALLCTMCLIPASQAAVTEEVVALVSPFSTTKELYYQNRQLASVIDLAMTCYQRFGTEADTREYRWSDGPLSSSPGGTYKSALYLLENDGATLTIEFHGSAYGDGYGGIGIGFCLQLTQEGPDIYGQILWEVGFTGSNAVFEESWATITSNSYETEGSNLKLTFEFQNDHPRTVTFAGHNNAYIGTYTVPVGEWDALPPTPPEVEGYVFYAWDQPLNPIKENTTITALYHRLCTVTFMDADGETVLGTQLVEETKGATAPDMSGHDYEGTPFAGWDGNFAYVTGDLVVTAVYDELPILISEFIDEGLLPANGLVWNSTKSTGSWNGTSEFWFGADKTPTAWVPGSTAIFLNSAEITLEGPCSAREILTFQGANLTFKGNTLEMVSPSRIFFQTNAVLRFENMITGANGLVITASPSIASTNACVEIAGDLALTDKNTTIIVSNVTVRVVDEGTLGGGKFENELRLADNARLSLESSVYQQMSGRIKATSKNNNSYVITQPGSNVMFDSDKGDIWYLRIAGNSITEEYSSLPSSGGKTQILDGGVLEIRKTYIYGTWGPNVTGEDAFFVQKGGMLRLTTKDSIGVTMHTHVVGGLVTNEAVVAGNNMPPLVYRFHLSDGGRFVGTGVSVGYKDYYDTLSFIEAYGKSPSSFEAESILIGFQYPATTAKQKIGIEFKVSDVTDDEETDLTVTSTILDRQGVELYKNDGLRTNVGVFKSGPGTLELTGANSACTTGVFSVSQGTVRIGETCSGAFGAFVLAGESSLDCAGGSMNFDASSDMIWAEEATLTVTGDLGPRTLRFGTDASGLTREQLAQIKSDDPSKIARLSQRGYLSLARPETLLLFR